MKILNISPENIITMNDYPVYNPHILKILFRIFQLGDSKIVPPCPCLKKEQVLNGINTKIKKKLIDFFKLNPNVEYFLIDGSHKSTAAYLTKNKVRIMVFESNEDINEAKKLVEIGELFSLTVGSTINDNIKILDNHFKDNKTFFTVASKARKMIDEKVIPDYMIKYHESN
ncbi:MAG: hypothetical protein WC867_05850 [Candidatus Pacearchaeota archaeon]|jgi:hypothetical protein